MDSFSFRIARPPNKKNGTMHRRGTGRPTLKPEVVRAQNMISVMAKLNADRASFRHNGEPVSVTMTWDGNSDKVDVIVSKIKDHAPSPRRFDLQNISDIVLDALQQSEVLRDDKYCCRVIVQEIGL